MKFFSTCTVAILLLSTTPALAHPQPVTDIQSVSTREREVVERDNPFFEDVKDLWKRKGGGGGGGKGGSGSSGSSGGKGGSGGSGGSSGYVPSSPGIGGESGSLGARGSGVGSSTSYWSSRTSTSKELVRGSSSSLASFKRVFAGIGGWGRVFSSSRGSKSSSSSKSNKHSSSSVPKGSSVSNTGGTTRQGSGVTPNYGGGRYYGGGATTPYTAGSRSPLGLVAIPLAFGAGALAFYPGLWLYGAYAYPYNHVSDTLTIHIREQVIDW